MGFIDFFKTSAPKPVRTDLDEQLPSLHGADGMRAGRADHNRAENIQKLHCFLEGDQQYHQAARRKTPHCS